MASGNADIAAAFEEIADILEIQGENPFRVRAYRNAARVVQGYGTDIAGKLRGGGEVPRLPGIGADLAARIRELAMSGRSELLERLRRQVPPGMVGLLRVPGLGPRRVRLLYEDLRIESPEQLLRAAREGRVRGIPGFGVRTEEKLLRALEAGQGGAGRVPIAQAAGEAERLLRHLSGAPEIVAAAVAGSYRRMRDTVGDLDILVAGDRAAAAMQRFFGYDGIAQVLAHGTTRAAVRLRAGLQVDLRAVRPASYGAALVYFTGSKAHNLAMRRRALERGLKLSEYGVFRGRARIAGDTEESVYAALGLPFIPPELREDRGEIQAALAGTLPALVERADLRGDLHVHTRASDGQHTLEEMAEAARRAGLSWLAIADRSRRPTVAHGLDPARLRRQGEEIDRLNRRLRGITLLKGIEVEILEDGTLDLPDEALAGLDVVVGAVHSHFDLPREAQTRRLLRALAHRHFTVLAHPGARLIGQRAPIDFDLGAVIAAAVRRGCALELNAQPQRMDLDEVGCREARSRGVPIGIASDAHAAADFDHLRFGVGQARRGWLEKRDVLNTRSLRELRALLRAGAAA